MLTLIRDGQEIQARDHRDPGHFWADKEIIEGFLPDIGLHAFAVYMLLAYHARSNTGRCWPSIGDMAKRLGISKPTIRKALETLASNKLILISPNSAPSPNGKEIQQAYTYTLVSIDKESRKPNVIEQGVVKDVYQGGKPDLPGVVKDVYQGGKPDLPGVVKDVYPNKNNVNKNKKLNTSANPPIGVSQGGNSATTSDPAIRELNTSLTALTTVQENSFPTKSAEEEPPSKVPPKVSPAADWWKSEGLLAKLMLDARCAYTSRGIPETYINPGLERICNGSLRRWWEKFAYPSGSVDFMDAVEKDARQIVQGAEYIKAHELPPATPPNAAEASPMPQNENKALLAPVSKANLDSWYVDAPSGLYGPYSSYEAVKRGADEHGGRITQGQAVQGKQAIRVDKKATKPKVERKPDPVFDAVALGSFGLPKVAGKVGGRIGGLVKEIKECTEAAHLPTLATDLLAMYDWRKKTYPQLSAPTQGLTICKYLAEWRQAKNKPVQNSDQQWMPQLV